MKWRLPPVSQIDEGVGMTVLIQKISEQGLTALRMTLCAAEGCPSFSTRVTSINAAAAAPVTETLRPPVDPALAFFSPDALNATHKTSAL